MEFNGRSELEALIPEMILKGKYQADGRVLILPIVGNGDCEIICSKFQLTIKAKQKIKNFCIYLQKILYLNTPSI